MYCMRADSARKREQILDAAADTFATQGFAGARVDGIAAAAGLNKRLLYHVMERAGVPLEKTFTNIERYGNTSAASAFIALDEAVRHDCFKRGDLIVLMAIGAGMNWGAHLIRW